MADPSNAAPDGNWLDYESGSYHDEPYDLSLNLLNLDDGSIKQIGAGVRGFVSSSSPNKKWFFLEQEERVGWSRFSLYDETYQRIKSWMLDDDVRRASWRPDSLGIFLFTDDKIYYLDIPDGEPQLLNVEAPSCPWDPVVCTWPEFTWLP